jgi:beta-phosphoglucomutase family hydrolase
VSGDVRAHEVLGRGLRAFLFDLDGVVTDTAAVHAHAWKRLFDVFLTERAGGGEFAPFRLPDDYFRYVDGKPRYDGVRDFLASRGLTLPEGAADDPPDRPTVHGLGNRKDRLFNAVLDEEGVRVFESSVALIRQLRRRGTATACVTSSRNGRGVLARTGLLADFDTIVDGTDIAREGLRGKPAPDSFLVAAARLGVPAGQGAVVEDAVSGIAAGKAGLFGLVIGVDRGVGSEALRTAGADLVVQDLAELLPAASI